MAKISSYATDGVVTISDRVIGSDNENANETKNYLVGDIINLAVNEILPLLPSIYVPYTGATTNVDLGINGITTDYVYTTNIINSISSDLLYVGASTSTAGLLSNSITETIAIGDVNYNNHGCTISVDDPNRHITFANGSLNMEGDPGTPGSLLVSNGGGTVPIWTPFSTGIFVIPYLAAHSQVQQTAALANTGYAMIFNSVDLSNLISVVNGSSGSPTRITFAESGKYNIQFSAQLQRTTGGASATADIWFRKGGVDVISSNTSVNVQANAGYLVASWNFFVFIDSEAPNPYIEIIWAVTDTAIVIAQAAANAVHPSTPSVIVTVNKISN